MRIYQLVIDNGQEDVREFAKLSEASAAFVTACDDPQAYSASVYTYDSETMECRGRIFHRENRRRGS